MKKKIKDLTLEEVNAICKEYSTRDEEGFVHCNECPLGNSTYCICLNSDKEWFLERYGNREIEVDEDEKEN